MRASGVWQVLILIIAFWCAASSTACWTLFLHPLSSRRHEAASGQDTHADFCAAEFRGPGAHHRFDDSPDDYDMDMDQRTRFIGGRAGRIILLGDGTEILTGNAHDDDGDVDMEDRGEAEEAEENDLEEQVQKGKDANAPNGETSEEDRSKREETPSPALQGKTAEPAEDSKKQESETSNSEPKTLPAVDNADTKLAAEQKESN